MQVLLRKSEDKNKRVSDMSRREAGEVDQEKGDVMNTQSTSIKPATEVIEVQILKKTK